MLSIEQLTGKDPERLIALPNCLTSSLSQTKLQIADPEAISALLELQQLADKSKLSFQVVSSYRSFDDQKNIWNRKYNGELSILDINEEIVDTKSLTALEIIRSIMLFSALPGASRHHWGSDFDIFPTSALNNGYQPQLLESEFTGSGIAADLNHWLIETLPGTAFFRPYEKFQQGIASEPWHVSYRPIATPALAELTIPRLTKVLMKESDIAGQQTICENISSLYKQYICNICSEDNQP